MPSLPQSSPVKPVFENPIHLRPGGKSGARKSGGGPRQGELKQTGFK